MTTLTSALAPLFAAMANAINGDATLQALLAGDRVYSLTAPSGAPLDYIVLGTPSSSGFATFAQHGEVSAITVHVWTAGVDAARALAIYGELFRVWHLKPMAVAGHTLCYGALSLTTVMPDPVGEIVHLVAMYRPTTLPT